MTPSPRRVAIVGGVRIPFARANTAYNEATNQQMLTATLKSLVSRFNLENRKVGEVAAGAVIKHSRDWNLARESTLGSGLHPETPAYDVQRACGTSLTAAVQVAHRIAAGEIECGIAGGVDSASDIPLTYGPELQKIVLTSVRGRSFREKTQPWLDVRPGHFKPSAPGIAEPRTGLSMGQHAEETAKEWRIGRTEQDELAAASHRNAAAAWKAGFFEDLVVPFNDLRHDNNVRARYLAREARYAAHRVRPLFRRHAHRRQQLAAHRRRRVRSARVGRVCTRPRFSDPRFLTYSETAAVDFVGMAGPKEGMLMAPAYAVPRMLDRAGLTLQDFDIYEIHEAFAAQVLCTLKAWESAKFCRDTSRPRACRSVPSTASSSTPRARASPSAIRSPPPARASSPRSPSSLPSAARGAG